MCMCGSVYNMVDFYSLSPKRFNDRIWEFMKHNSSSRTAIHIFCFQSRCNAIKFDDVAHRKLSMSPDLCHQNWNIYGFFSGPVYMVLVQQFSIFPCIKQWNEWFYFAFIFNGVWIAFRETCNTPFQNNTLPKLQSRKSHGNVLTFLTFRLLIFRCVIISYTHLYTCQCANMLAACEPFFISFFNVIEIYSVCVSSESCTSFALYIFIK